MKAETKMDRKYRFYPCPKCGMDHPSSTTLLGMIHSPALSGWLAKNGVAKLNILRDVLRVHIDAAFPITTQADNFLSGVHKDAEDRWKLAEKTAFWKSGKETGKEAADYGTIAHAWIESHLHGIEIDLRALPEPAQNAVNGFLAWEKENQVEVIATEETFVNCALNYAGTADAVLKINGELTLIDWKTSDAVYSTYPIQCFSYALADESQHGDRLYRQVAVGRFGKSGDWEVRIFKRNDFPGIELSREVMIGCGAIFKFQQAWEKRFPYVRKEKEKTNGIV